MSYHDDYDDCDDYGCDDDYNDYDYYDHYDYRDDYEDEKFGNMARTIMLVMVIFHPLIKRQVDT